MSVDDGALRERREAIVREHIESESRGDFGATVRTFDQPRYEVVPTGEVHDGSEAVSAFLAGSGAAFPDLRFTIHALHHAEEAVFAEVTFEGTHLGPWRGLPPTGRRVTYRMLNVFCFRGASLVCERLYFDLLTVMRQLGIARDPTTLGGRATIFLNHPVTTSLAVLRSAIRRLAAKLAAR